MPPQTLYLPLPHLVRWFERAEPGQRSPAYAAGEALDPKNETARQVREWIDAGLATAVKPRGADGVLRHCVVKVAESGRPPAAEGTGGTNAGCAVMPPAGCPAREGRAKLTENEMMVLGVLRQQVPGKPVPSFETLRRLAGLRSRGRARHAFDRLVAMGLVRVRRAGEQRLLDEVKG